MKKKSHVATGRKSVEKSVGEKTYVVTTIAGVFTLDEKNKILSYKKFPKDSVKIADL